MTPADLRLKRAHGRYRRALKRELRKAWWRCVWSRPFGHWWPVDSSSKSHCKSCGRPNTCTSNLDISDLEDLYEDQLGVDDLDLDEEKIRAMIPPKLLRAAEEYYEAYAG